MRRTQAKHTADGRRPGVAAAPAVGHGGATDQSAHAVPDQHDFVDRNRPLRDEPAQQVREAAAVVRNMRAGVVAQIERAVAGFLQALAVRARMPALRIPIELPAGLVAAQAVYEYREAWLRRRERSRQGFARQRQGQAVNLEGRTRGERTAPDREVIAEGAAQGAGDGIETRPCMRRFGAAHAGCSF